MILLVMLCLIFLIQDTDSNNMVDLVKYPIFQEYSDYLTEDEIKTDMVKNIQKRIMGMSDMQRNELGISDDFLQSNNLSRCYLLLYIICIIWGVKHNAHHQIIQQVQKIQNKQN